MHVANRLQSSDCALTRFPFILSAKPQSERKVEQLRTEGDALRAEANRVREEAASHIAELEAVWALNERLGTENVL